MTDEEIADTLSRQDGRPVSVAEVRRVGARAMQKAGDALRAWGYTAENLIPELWRGPCQTVAVNELNIPIGEDHPKTRHADAKVEQVLRMRSQGAGYGAIAKALEMPRSTVRDICNGRLRCQVAARYRPTAAKA